jgi:hypothetical protein
MEGNDLQPYDQLTTRELEAISRWLDTHVKDLRGQHAAIQSELRHRQRTEPVIDHAVPSIRSHRLNYQTPNVSRPREALLDDSYFAEARSYGLRVALIGGVLIALAILILCILAVV